MGDLPCWHGKWASKVRSLDLYDMYCVPLCYGEIDCCIGMESGHLKQGILSVIIMHTGEVHFCISVES